MVGISGKDELTVMGRPLALLRVPRRIENIKIRKIIMIRPPVLRARRASLESL